MVIYQQRLKEFLIQGIGKLPFIGKLPIEAEAIPGIGQGKYQQLELQRYSPQPVQFCTCIHLQCSWIPTAFQTFLRSCRNIRNHHLSRPPLPLTLPIALHHALDSKWHENNRYQQKQPQPLLCICCLLGFIDLSIASMQSTCRSCVYCCILCQQNSLYRTPIDRIQIH